ncbi:MAPEG family protein [Marinicella gelatinilytica]|uniref:MAPEG family protein n=1 Tax=Marinicella gelatinilytica TaxID=2996017 RepID=UPI002260BDBE|nr:MAPEG family protein [Marinicella gelatinilytica]MCX7544415.1 MAPEG family protein [Marinicella gelatinilytica]
MLIVTALYASLLALIVLWLSYNVVNFRRKKQVDLGDGGHDEGIRHIRAHQNTLEYVPIIIILMAVYEINNGLPLLLHISGIVLVIARIIYPLGLVAKKGASFGRFYGTLFTWLVLLTLIIVNLFKVISAWL